MLAVVIAEKQKTFTYGVPSACGSAPFSIYLTQRRKDAKKNRDLGLHNP